MMSFGLFERKLTFNMRELNKLAFNKSTVFENNISFQIEISCRRGCQINCIVTKEHLFSTVAKLKVILLGTFKTAF